MKFVYTDDAIGHLHRLRTFIAEYNPPAASRIAADLVSRIELLAGAPEIGSPVELAPEPDSIRDMIFGKYVVRYSVHQSTVIILRLWHSLEAERS